MRIGVLQNPRSGANLKPAASLRRLLDAHPQILCREVLDPASVAAALRAMADRGIDTVAISGGDGTVNAVLNTVFGRSPFARLPLLAVLRGGTANMTARDIGMPGRQDRALRALLDCAARGGDGLTVVERPVMRIDPGAGREPIHGMFFGAAAITQGIEYCKREVHALGLRGEIGPAVTMLRFIVAMARGERAIVAPVPITVAVDAEAPASFACEIVHVTTLEQLVLGLRPFWGRESAPLHYASVRAAPRHWIKALPGLLRGRPNRYVTPANGYESRNAHRLLLGLDSHFFVDGEIFSPTAGSPLAITAGGSAGFVKLR
jgi:diacylglycerol kinase (ATP)